MEDNLLKEIHYLTRLIEQHKKQSLEKVNNENALKSSYRNFYLQKTTHYTNYSLKSEANVNEHYSESNKNTYPTLKPTMANVYVNPNFKPQNSMVHINPRIRSKPMIHVNPKLIKRDAVDTNKYTETENTSVSIPVKPSVVQTNVKRSVYINPKLMTKLSPSAVSKMEDKGNAVLINNRPNCSRLKASKTVSNITGSVKNANTNIVVLSKRKLVRVKRMSKGSLTASPLSASKVKRLSHFSFKKNKTTPLKSMKEGTSVDNLTQLVNKNCVKPKMNRYKIDRTVSQLVKVKGYEILENNKATNKKLKLINIGGIVYKSSRNQLVRRSYSLRKKRSVNTKNDKLVVVTNGTKLRRLKVIKNTSNQIIINNSPVNKETQQKFENNVAQKLNYKMNIRNKVKQRSIQILRNKMRKNNQPCLLFQRFGYCANQKNGLCPKLHDKKQVSLCKRFLQGKCLINNCPLSHDVGPEKMPTCKYFLEGCCTRDACPYLHVKVSSNTSICLEFLKGYCAKGNECTQRHENVCPEFDKAGKCSKGKYCPYPHKSHLSSVKQIDGHLQNNCEISESLAAPNVHDISMFTHENRLRYYDTPKTLDKTKEAVVKKASVKSVETVAQLHDNDGVRQIDEMSILGVENSDNELKSVNDNQLPRRRPIGSLPAYIPIN